MCVTKFRELCDKGGTYWFENLEDFYKGIDYNGRDLKKKGIEFKRGVNDEYER